MRALLSAGTDPNKVDVDGRVPLHFASKFGVRPAVASTLLNAGADPLARDRSGQLPIDLAMEDRIRTTEVYERLRARGRGGHIRRLRRLLATILG